MNPVEQLVRAPVAAVEFANLLLTRDDARDRGHAEGRRVDAPQDDAVPLPLQPSARHALPVLLVFALINRPDIFDLRPGNSFVEFLLEEGYDVFLLDWGVPGDEDADMGIDYYVCDELPWGMRETLRASGQDELSACSAGASAARSSPCTPRSSPSERRRATSCC